MINDRKILNIVYLLLVALFVSLCLSFFKPLNISKATTHPKLSGGMGSFSNPYIISTREDLVALSKHVYSGGETKNQYYKISNAIDMKNINFTPIGTMVGSNIHYFDGHFDGNNCLIYNLKIQNASNANGDLGFFGYIRDPNDNGNYITEIKNIRLYSGEIKLTEKSKSAGGVVGSAYKNAIIENCSNIGVTVNVEQGNYGDTFVGGILGACHSNDATIKSCYNIANHSNCTNGIAKTGGIAGEMSGKTTECFNNGTITSGSVGTETSFGGGICGIGRIISYCYNKGNIEGYSITAFKLISVESDNYLNQNAIPNDLFNVSVIEVGSGYNWNYDLTNQGSQGTEYTVKAYTGGIAGNITYSVEECYNLGEIYGGYRYKTRQTQIGIKNSNQELQATTAVSFVIESDSYTGDIWGYNWENISASKIYAKGKSEPAGLKELTWEANASTTLDINWDGESNNKLFADLNFKFEINKNNLEAKLTTNYTVKTQEWYKVGIGENFWEWFIGKWKYRDVKETKGSVNITSFTAFRYRSNDYCTQGDMILSNKWAICDYINNGYPYLKSIYWSGSAQSFNN